MIPRPRATVFATAALLLTLTLHPLAAQRPAPAQRGGAPKPDTPQLVVSVLASSDPSLGIAASDAIRRRIQNEHSATDLYVVPKPTIDNTLRAAGFNPDSALGPTDLLALSKQVRGDYAIEGNVERTTSGVRTFLRLLTQRGQLVVAEPLEPIAGPDFGDIAKQVDHAVSEVLRGLAFHRECMNAFVLGDYPKALAAAQQGLRIRPTSVALNQCVLSTLRATHASADSIIAVASTIANTDSTNSLAWTALAEGYAEKNDTVHALSAAQTLYRLDPTSTQSASNVVDWFVVAGRTEGAFAILDSALRNAPGNAELLRKKWLLQLRVGRFADAIATGSALIATDSTAATSDFFERQLAAAKSARDSVAAHRVATDGAARFPKNTTFLLTLARDAVDQGASAAPMGFIDRVLAIEPANAIAWQLAISAYAKANNSDSAIATARRAIAAGVARDAVGASLVAIVAPALSAAQKSSKRADWDAALKIAQAVDSVAPSSRTSFYLGASAYSIALDEAQTLTAFAGKRTSTRVERQAACTSATHAEEMVSLVSIAMPKGGSSDPTNAATILGALPGMSEFVTSVKQAACRARPDQ